LPCLRPDGGTLTCAFTSPGPLDSPNYVERGYEDDGSVKLGGYDRRFQVTEVLNRAGGAHVFVSVRSTDPDRAPREVTPRADDLVTVERGVVAALRRAGRRPAGGT